MPGVQTSVPFDGLATLARAAAMQSPSPEVDPRLSSCASDFGIYHLQPATPNSTHHKRRKNSANIPTHTPGPDLAPIRFSPSSSFPSAVPDFPSMPSMSEISSLAGSGCSCGVLCACPGCIEHANPENDAGARRDCGEGCGSCIDHSIEALTPFQAKESTHFLDCFFARAAALPPPPPAHRKMGSYHLDPMNADIYASASNSGSQPFTFTFGGINLPRLSTSKQDPAEVTVAHDRNQAQSAQIDRHTPSLDDSMPALMEPRGNCCSESG